MQWADVQCASAHCHSSYREHSGIGAPARLIEIERIGSSAEAPVAKRSLHALDGTPPPARHDPCRPRQVYEKRCGSSLLSAI
jgi:hypothetical protein